MASPITPEQLIEKLKNISTNAKSTIKVAILDSCLLVERDAKLNAPTNKDPNVSAGTLRDSITHEVNQANDVYEGKVGAQANYGKFQEYGTGQRGAASNVATPADYEYGSSRGIPAQPYLGPALLANKAKIQKLISKTILKALREA